MSTDRRELEDWEKAECAALKEVLDAYRVENSVRGRKMSQTDLAEVLGMAQGNLNGHLNGKRPIRVDLAIKIAEKLKIPAQAYSSRLADEIKRISHLDALFDQVDEETGVPALDANEIRAKNAAGKPSSPADLVKAMLESKAGKALPPDARERLLRAAEEEPEPEAKSVAVITADFSRSARVVNGDVLIPQYNVRGSMGHGQVVGEYVEFVRNMVVAGSELGRLGLEITSPSNLSIITGWGQSMAPTIQDKDPVVVDRGVTSYQDDGIYVITWDNHLFIKRLHKAAGGKLKIISDCRPHDSDTVDPEDIYVHGKVLYIWNGSKA